MPTTLSRRVAWLLIALLPAAATRADLVQVGSQTGAQIFFNNTLVRTYNFAITQSGAGTSFDTVYANIKGNGAAPQNIAPVFARVYDNLGGTGSVIATGTVAASALTVQFDYRAIPLSTTLALPAGYYSVVITTSNVADYYLKNGALTLTNTAGTVLSSSAWVQDNNTNGTAGTTLIASGTVNATWTLGTNAASFGNYRVGTTLSATTPLINTAIVTSNTVTQALAISGTSITGGINSLTGLPSPYLSVGGTSNVVARLNGATTGPNSGTANLAFSSVPGTSLTSGTTAVGSGTLTLTGTGYDWANAAYSGTAFAFGYIHRGGAAASGTAAIGNQAVVNAAYQDSLTVSATTGNPLVAANGFSGLAASAGGATRGNLVVSIGTGTAGSLASTLALSLVSNANGVVGLSNGTATVAGSPGSITTTGTVFTGQSTWNTNGGGQWGTLASSFGSNWNWTAFDGSPGVDPSFTDTDTATFGNAVTSGTATVTVTAAAPSVKSVTFNNSAASYAIAGASGGSLALLNAGTTAATIAVAAGTHAMSLPVSLGSNTGIDVFAGSILSMSGVISGGRNVAKTGSGTTIFSGNNSYGGTTSVSAGRLLIHGNQSSATGAITVAGGATLGGRGTAGGAVTVLGSGILSPGASIESLAVGATTFASGSSIFAYEVDSSVLVGSGSAADLLVSNGNLSIASGSILEFTDLALSPTAFPDGTKFTLISYGGNSWNSGLFTYQGNELANLERFSTGLNQWEIRYDDTTGGSNFTGDQLAGSYVTIQAVPEPASVASIAIGLGLVAFVIRRRARQ
jgi:fibronectin-binding autotransporter adhesin